MPVWQKTSATSTYLSCRRQDCGRQTVAFIGGIYLDLYPREAIQPAAAFPYVPVRRDSAHADLGAGHELQSQGLDHDSSKRCCTSSDMDARRLSKTRYDRSERHIGQARLCRSAFANFEEWARREEALKLLPRFVPECHVESAQIEQLDACRKYGQAALRAATRVRALRMNWHTGAPPPQGTWAELEVDRPRPFEARCSPQASPSLGG